MTEDIRAASIAEEKAWANHQQLVAEIRESGEGDAFIRSQVLDLLKTMNSMVNHPENDPTILFAELCITCTNLFLITNDTANANKLRTLLNTRINPVPEDIRYDH